MSTELHAITGAFGFSGRYIARNLLDRGRNVITLTNSLHCPNPFGESVKAYPFNFDNPEKLTESLSGVSVLYNTYWVRFNYKTFGYSTAIQNTFALFEAAKKAGVKRIVHTSITNPSESSPYEYFRDKAIIEKNLIESGIPYAILRPAVLFGKEGILINNIAWALRKFPFFSIFGEGNYRLQPIYVNDFATLAVEQGEKSENTIINAIGPETFSYRELVTEIGDIINKKRPFVSVSPFIGYCLALIIGKFVHDIMITKDEIEGLMDDLLYVDAPPAGNTKLTEWARENASILGKQYESELARRRTK